MESKLADLRGTGPKRQQPQHRLGVRGLLGQVVEAQEAIVSFDEGRCVQSKASQRAQQGGNANKDAAGRLQRNCNLAAQRG